MSRPDLLRTVTRWPRAPCGAGINLSSAASWAGGSQEQAKLSAPSSMLPIASDHNRALRQRARRRSSDGCRGVGLGGGAAVEAETLPHAVGHVVRLGARREAPAAHV